MADECNNWDEYILDPQRIEDLMFKFWDSPCIHHIEASVKNFIRQEQILMYVRTRTCRDQDMIIDDEKSICAICLDDLHQPGGKIAALGCGHDQFHADCIKPWLMKETLCPLCRAQVFPYSDSDYGRFIDDLRTVQINDDNDGVQRQDGGGARRSMIGDQRGKILFDDFVEFLGRLIIIRRKRSESTGGILTEL